MKLWVERLRFKWLLYLVYILIRIAARKSDELRTKLQKKDIAVALQCLDKTVSRTIRCSNGKVRSQAGEADDVVSRIVWITPRIGAKVIRNVIKGDPKALVKAVIAKELLPQGDAGGIRWFLDVVGMLNRIFRGEKKPASAASGIPPSSNKPPAA